MGKTRGILIKPFRKNLETVRRKAKWVRQDPMTPDTRLSDNTNAFNPATPDALFQLTMGGPAPKRAQAVHCMFRYFDPGSRRCGLPEDVAALVDTVGERRSRCDPGQLEPGGSCLKSSFRVALTGSTH